MAPPNPPTCSLLLVVDGVANLVFGAFLLLAPRGIFEALGLPWIGHSLYGSILGGVLLGIGLALLLEARRAPAGWGLGLGGAVAINLCAALAIGAWWARNSTPLAPRGRVVLAVLTAFLVALSAAEIWIDRRSARPG